MLTKTETAKWGQQKDAPEEGTAIFPPDQPMGWPADSYKRARSSISTAMGAPSTSLPRPAGCPRREYNGYNDVVRTLSPDNRAAALKESCESEKLQIRGTRETAVDRKHVRRSRK